MTGRFRCLPLLAATTCVVIAATSWLPGCDGARSGSGRIEPLSIAPFLRKPFAGDYPITNVFDHDLPIVWADANGHSLTFFGERTVGLDGHQGYDFAMPEGTPLLAAAAGVVTRAGWGSESYCPPLGRTTRNLAVMRLVQEPADGVQEVRDRDRLGDIGLAAALADALLISLHGEGGDRHDWDRLQLGIVLEPFGDFEAGNFRQLNVH